MNPLESFRIALRSLGANRLRAALTMLGVVIGVAAVISLLAIGRGAQVGVTSSVESLGTNLLFVQPGTTTQGGVQSAAGSGKTLTLADAEALADPLNVPSAAAVAPEVATSAQAVYGGSNANVRVFGVTPDYQSARNTPLLYGEYVTQAHVQSRAAVAVLGSQIAAELFGQGDPLGKRVFLDRVPARVIGVLESKGGTGFFNPDQSVYVPITFAQSRLGAAGVYRGQRTVSSITVQVADASLMDRAQEEIRAVLRDRHRLTGEDDFTILNQLDFLETLSQVTAIFTLFLAGIAAISLVVGGVGLMNILLVSVAERTREIGIRKAVGARSRDILAQFLVEALVLAVTGGLVGIAMGFGVSRLVSGLSLGGSSVQAVVEPDAVLLAVLFSAAVGLFFGVYPAWRASRLRPIEALRYE